MKPLHLLDLFSGVGAFSLGLERAGGFETVAFCEIDPFCRDILARHWPKVPCYDDVTTLTGERLAADGVTVDAICGGFPCQGISIAGKGRGLDDARSGLWEQYRRLIGELCPRVAIIENSPKLRSRGLHTILADLDALGFDAEWHCIPASHVGAPHRRDRIWIIAHRQGDALGSYADSLRSHQTEMHVSRGAELRNEQVSHTGPMAWRNTAPPVQRVVDGAASRLDVARLGCAGRAVVPQIPELIGRAILSTERLAA